MNRGLKTRRGWLYQLPDPFNLIPYYPVDDHQLAALLNLSARTAVRVCKGEKALRACEVQYLQVVIFGLIPDPAFVWGKWHVRDGVLRSHNASFELAADELTAFAALRHMQAVLMADLATARQRIAELQAELWAARNELPPNVIRFPAR